MISQNSFLISKLHPTNILYHIYINLSSSFLDIIPFEYINNIAVFVLISNLEHIDRGYENIEEKFRNLGADIRRVVE